MSVVSIRAALETALAAITPAMSTAYENAPFTPVNGTLTRSATYCSPHLITVRWAIGIKNKVLCK